MGSIIAYEKRYSRHPNFQQARAAFTLIRCPMHMHDVGFHLLFFALLFIHWLILFSPSSSSTSCVSAPINCEKSHMVSPLAHLMQSPTSRAYILYHLKIGMRTLLPSFVASPLHLLHVSSLSSFHTSYRGVSGLWRGAFDSTYGALLQKANLIIIRKFFFHLFLYIFLLILYFFFSFGFIELIELHLH